MRKAGAAAAFVASIALAAAPSALAAPSTGGTVAGVPSDVPAGGIAPVAPATLVAGVAKAPPGAPRAVRRVIRAGNKLQKFPYRYGGGHRSFTDTAYDCSGTVSFALRGAKLVKAPLNSTGFMSWGLAGEGRWISVYANSGHAFMVVAGLRLDTSGTHGTGPRWQVAPRAVAGFVVRHPSGL
jgi:hypothetical protein